jgi:hypothetical protein
MIKMMILAPRRSGMTHAEFRSYVTKVHGPLVKSVEEVAADIHHYHYNFPIADASDTLFGHPVAKHLDIVTEAWFDSVEAQLQNMAHPRYMQIIRPDEHRFADGDAAVMHYTREISIIDGDRSLFKLFYFRRRKPTLDREEFQRQWLTGFRKLLSEYPEISRAIAGCVQNQVVSEVEHPNGTDLKYFDVIDEFFVSDLQKIAAISRQKQMIAALRQLENDLLETSRTQAFVAETVMNIP